MDPFMMGSASKAKTVSKHVFSVHSYQKPTFCNSCGKLLVGIARQGYQCKRCEINVHKKCRKDVEDTCIEMIVGHHNFLSNTYTHPTFCDVCNKLLAGVFHQGLQCSECGCNVHEKCQERVEVKCDETLRRIGKLDKPNKAATQTQDGKSGKSSGEVMFEKVSPKQQRKETQETVFETMDDSGAFKKQEIPKAVETEPLAVQSSPSTELRAAPKPVAPRQSPARSTGSELTSSERARIIAEDIEPKPKSPFKRFLSWLLSCC